MYFEIMAKAQKVAAFGYTLSMLTNAVAIFIFIKIKYGFEFTSLIVSLFDALQSAPL